MTKVSDSEISVAVGNRVVRGRYRTNRGMVTVISEFGEKTTRIGAVPPKSLARMMLRELLTTQPAGEER
jgi:hypothetical protein